MTDKQLRIVVCVKQVPEDDLHPDVADHIGLPPKPDRQYLINDLDLQAVEQALQFRESGQVGEVVLVSLGPTRVEEALYRGLAMGANRAVHVVADDQSWSAQQTAAVLAMVIGSLEYDLILCGERSSDGGSSCVGPALAEMLDLPQATAVHRLELPSDRTRAVAHRRLDRGRREVLECELPALISVASGLSKPRYTSLLATKRARQRPLRRITLEELGFAPDDQGSAAPAVKLMSYTPPRPRPRPIFVPGGDIPAYERIRLLLAGAPDKEGSWLEGEPEDVAEGIVSFLDVHGILSRRHQTGRL